MTRPGARPVLAGIGLAAALLYFIGLAAEMPGLRLAVKPFPALALAAWVILRDDRPTSALTAMGLALSAAGDLLLETARFLPGLVAFLAAHLAYVAAFLAAERRPALARAVPFVAWRLGALSLLRSGLGDLRVPVSVYVTPACGYVGLKGALVIGLAAGLVCLWAVVWLKSKLGYDDSLDVFGLHCIGGILGALLTGVFVNPDLGGTGVYDYVANQVGSYDFGAQMYSQILAVATSVIWSGVVALISYKIVDLIVGLRVTEEQEREGLDETQHGERAYNV